MPNDLNSVLSIAKHQSSTIKYDSPRKDYPGMMKNRVAQWDPYELAAKIKSQIDIDKLLAERILRKNALESTDLIAFQNFAINSAEHIQNEKTLAYVKKNPIDMGDLGFKNSAYSRCLRDEATNKKLKVKKRNLPESFDKLPEETQRRSMQFM